MKADWRSIRFRLTALYTVILTVTFALIVAFVLFVVRDAAEETIDNDLRARLVALREYLPIQPGSNNDAREEQFATGPGAAWLRIADTNGRWIYRSDLAKRDASFPPSANGLRSKGKSENVLVHGRHLRVLTAPVPGGVAQLGAPMGEFEEMFEELRWALGLTTPLLLILACSSGYWMSGRALRPVDEIEKTVRRIGSRTLTERLSLRGTGDELDRLSVTINQMLERLESAFRLVVRFTADASHELRTPVAIIRTTGEVIRESPRTPKEHEEAWDQVVGQTERMSRLVDDLLLLARADAGHSDVVFETVDLAEIVSAAAREMKVLANASGLELTWLVPPVCRMSGDPDALRRVMLILIDNAIKYSAEGGKLAINLQMNESYGPRQAIIEVCDTGIGIADADLPRIFDRFYRVSTDRSRKTGGSGLGLSIAKWLVLTHGGHIDVESTPGKGSRFRVTLPLV